MARLTETLLNGKGYDTRHQTPMIDLAYGGQHGYAPNFGNLVSASAYVSRPLQALVLELPGFINYMPNPRNWAESIKALVEIHAEKISGLKAGLRVETDTTFIGGGSEFLMDPTNVVRDRSEPVFEWTEKYGRPIQNLLEMWQTYGIMDPDTKYSLLGTLPEGSRPDDLLYDRYGMTTLFFEADPMGRKINKAWLSTNMFPLETGDVEGNKDKSTAQQLLKLSIPFAATTQVGLGVNILAQQLLDRINMANSIPYLRKAMVDGVHSDVEAASVGLRQDIETLGREAVSSTIA